MAIGVNSYGTVTAVAAMTRRYTSAGYYADNTNPSITTVERWIDQVSGMLNVALAEKGFSIPITQADAKLALDGFVVEAVSDLAHAANSAGRYFTEAALERGVSPLRAIRGEIAAWVQEHAEGFEAIGAGRSVASTGGIGYRDSDDNGNEVSPLFGRDAFGADPRYGR